METDESKAHGEADPATCVAGYVATGKQWDRFSRAWNLMLKEYGVSIFHTKEIETEEGKRSVYKRWSKKKRHRFQNDIIDIIVGSGLQDVGIEIPLSVFKAVMTPDRTKTYGKTPSISRRHRLLMKRWRLQSNTAMGAPTARRGEALGSISV